MNPPQDYRDATIQLTIEPPMVQVHGQQLKLTAKEFALLAFLLANEGETLGRDQLLATIWGYDAPHKTRTLDVHIRRVRRKLGEVAARQIETVFSRGYRFRRISAESNPEDFFILARTAKVHPVWAIRWSR